MPLLCLHQILIKCGGQAPSEIPWLKCSERPGSRQLSAGRCGSVEVNVFNRFPSAYYYGPQQSIYSNHSMPTICHSFELIIYRGVFGLHTASKLVREKICNQPLLTAVEILRYTAVEDWSDGPSQRRYNMLTTKFDFAYFVDDVMMMLSIGLASTAFSEDE